MRKRILLLFCAAIAIGITMAFVATSTSIKMDGVITDGEWNGAIEYGLAGGGKLLMRKENEALYVAFVARKEAWSHVYLSHDDTVRVLHASAALGEAKYIKQNNLWKPVQSFNWELRDRVYNDELEKKQQEHYRRLGWVANNNTWEMERFLNSIWILHG